jgi:hypothetical protein
MDSLTVFLPEEGRKSVSPCTITETSTPSTATPPAPAARKGPSRKRSQERLNASSPKLARIISSGSGFDGQQIGAPSILDSILTGMTKTEEKRSTNVKFVELCTRQEEAELARRQAFQILESHEDQTGEAKKSQIRCLCPGGSTAEKDLEEAFDKSGMVCTKCGTIVAPLAMTPLFERVQRFDIPQDSSGRDSKSRMSFGVESSKERAKLRMSSVPATNVSRSHKAAQTKIHNAASRSEHTESVGLNHTQDLRRQRAMVEVHRMVFAVGRDPDKCCFFDNATRMIESAFLAAGAHSVVCGCTNGEKFPDMCPALFLTASPISIASEALRSAIDAVLAAESDDAGNATTDVSLSARQVRALLAPALSSYISAVHVSGPLRTRFHTLLHRKDQLKNACIASGGAIRSSNSSTSSSVVVYEAPDTLIPSTSTAKKVKLSVESLLKLGWIDLDASRVATRFCSSAEFVQWSSQLSEWSCDIVALMISIVATKGDKASLNSHMARLAKTERISMKTIEENMDFSLENYANTEGDIWN